jgi:hypothetical protein
MMNNWTLFFVVSVLIFIFTFKASTSSMATNLPVKNQIVCAPEQFMMTIDFMSTCISLEFKDEIIEAHRNISPKGNIYLNMSGSSKRNKMCLQCHVKIKTPAPFGVIPP